MVINREIFVRGWLPAGLVINARLLTDSTVMSNLAVLRPVINPVPGSSWPSEQGKLMFPVDQATSDIAIVLADPLEESSLALLPLGKWYGPGTPYILAVNTWYEGKVRFISGSDVMAIRLTAQVAPKYYSDYNNTAAKDVSIRSMVCHHLIGRHTEQVLALDDKSLTVNELGYAPRVSGEDGDTPARVLNSLVFPDVAFAGMRIAYADSTPGSSARYIQCSITAGTIAGQTPKYVGLIPNGGLGRQKFYTILQDKITGAVADIVKPDVVMGTIARSNGSNDQVVHYN